VTSYFLHFEYFATGEGMTHSWGYVRSETQDEAIEKFIRKTIMNGQSDEELVQGAINYFKGGVDVFDMSIPDSNKKLRDMLSHYFTVQMVDALIGTQKDGAMMEFIFHWYFNYS
jgi:hypothetical protein